MESHRITWSHDSFIDAETGHRLEDEEVLELMDRSARTNEIFTTLPKADVFPLRHGQFFEDWRIRVINHGSERYVKLDPASERTRQIVVARKRDWMTETFEYDEAFVDQYVKAAYGHPRAWISTTVAMVHDYLNRVNELRLVVGTGTEIRTRLKATGAYIPTGVPARDIQTAIRITEKIKDVAIYQPTQKI